MSSIESLFAKKNKKKKANRILELDDSGSKSRTSAESTSTGEGSILGADGCWMNDAAKKKVVYTGGKKVAEFINMNDLMTADEAAAERVYQEEQRREFIESRAAKDMQDKDKAQAESNRVAGENDTKKAEPKVSGERSLSSLDGGGWRARLSKKEMNKRVAKLDVTSTEAFPSLSDHVPAETTQAQSPSVWVGEPTAITANQDDSNGTGNQNSVVDKDEVVHDGCPNEDKGADVVQPETGPGSVDDPNPTVAEKSKPDGGGAIEEQLSSLDLLAKANKKVKKKKKKDVGKDGPQPQ